MTEKVYDYKKAFEDMAPEFLKMAHELDEVLIEFGVTHPVPAQLRIISAQFAGAGAGWRELVPAGYPPLP